MPSSTRRPCPRTRPARTSVSHANPAVIPSGKSPAWLAFALVSSSYFVALFGLLAFCIVLPS